jgi:hypothetical protein
MEFVSSSPSSSFDDVMVSLLCGCVVSYSSSTSSYICLSSLREVRSSVCHHVFGHTSWGYSHLDVCLGESSTHLHRLWWFSGYAALSSAAVVKVSSWCVFEGCVQVSLTPLWESSRHPLAPNVAVRLFSWQRAMPCSSSRLGGSFVAAHALLYGR